MREGRVRHGFGKAVWGAIVVLALCAPVDAASGTGKGGDKSAAKLDRALQERGNRGSSNDLQRVIVTVARGAKSGVRKRLENAGGRVHKDHGIVNAMTVSVDAHALDALIDDPDVERISADADMTALGGGNSEPVVSSLQKTLAIANWFVSSTTTIAVIDSGIAATADFSGRIVGTYDFTGGQNGVSRTAIDEFGHGTHVAGLAGSSGAISSGAYAGVAPGVKLLSLRVLDKKGAGKTSDVIAAIEFAVANKSRFNIRIINLSLGHPIYESATTDPLVRAVESAVRAGIVVVAAAGNYGANPITGQTGYAGLASPGNAPSAITVGAAVTGTTVERGDDRVATFSSRGPTWFDGYAKPDIVAPGAALLSDSVSGSTLEASYPSLLYPTTNGKLLRLSGSSMATAVVSGLVAVMIDANEYAAYQRYQSSGRLKKLAPYVPPPALTPNAIKAMLQYSATPLRDASGTPYDRLTQGAGEVDGLGAVTLAFTADTAKLPGTVWMPAVTPTTQFGTELLDWSQNIVWGTRLVSGAGLMEVNQLAWSQSITWGAGELDNIVWGTFAEGEGDNIVWGTAFNLADIVWAGSVLEGDNIVWGTTLRDWAQNIVWGTAIGVLEGDNIVWGTADIGEGDNIVWGTFERDNIVWGTSKVMGFVLVGGGL
jgi:serine protease AprX